MMGEMDAMSGFGAKKMPGVVNARHNGYNYTITTIRDCKIDIAIEL